METTTDLLILINSDCSRTFKAGRMELLKETAVVYWNAVPATAASPTPQGLSYPGTPVQCQVTTAVSIPAAFSVLSPGNETRTSLFCADNLTDCKEN